MEQTTKNPNLELEQNNELLKEIDKVIVHILEDIKKERSEDPPTEERLHQDIDQLLVLKEQVKNKINRLKGACAKRKNEISEWQQWFEKIEEVDKSLEKKQLDDEVNWRFKEITQKESVISRLYLDNQDFSGQIEAKKIQIEALKAGAHLLPSEEDPRLKEALRKKERLLSKINRLKKVTKA